MGKFVFDLVKWKTNFFSFFLFLAFIKIKKQILFQEQPLKMLNKKITNFRLTVNIFWGPAPS